MVAAPKLTQPITFEEYLELETTSDCKHELVDGYLHAFAGATDRHGEIVMNASFHLHGAARGGPCRVYATDMKLRLSARRGYYPDIIVVCDPSDNASLYRTRPCVIVEVSSPSTAATDRREKLPAYRQLPSLQVVLLVAQDEMRVERHWRDAEGVWWEAVLSAGDRVPIPCLDLELSIDALYEGVALPPPSRDDEF
jgi:Uma2 family endonuclease